MVLLRVSIPIWFDLKLHAILVSLAVICFNSYMVRFKERFLLPHQILSNKFQFLYGSI